MNLIEAHRAIWDAGLVPWTSGNVSERFGAHMLIKPSGVSCADVKETCSVRLATGRHAMDPKPSTDTEAHRYIYNAWPHVNAIVHTHSPAATGLACIGNSLPCFCTEMADVFGGDILCTPYAVIGDDTMGKMAVETIIYVSRPGGYRPFSKNAVLLAKHGVLTWGASVEEAVRAAIMLEHCAKIAHYAKGAILLSPEQIAENHARYQTTYGQDRSIKGCV